MKTEERVEYFFNNIIIEEDDIERANKFIYSKGIEKHIIILERLKPWCGGSKVEYEYIASSYRYDKRLRFVLFKYISYLEEYYRSIILDYFSDCFDKIEIVPKLKNELDEYGEMNSALEEIEFSTLVNQMKIINNSFSKKYVFPKMDHLVSNIRALVTFRNAVMHNKFLLLYRNLKECYLDDYSGDKDSNLKYNIVNLINFLPEEIRTKCICEINDCTKERNNDGKTNWKLPEFLCIQISNINK